MKREQTLRRHLQSQETLFEAVAAMKSLSAHHFRMARAALPAAQAYRDGIDQALATLGVAPGVPGLAPPGLLLVATDLGLCDGYNARLVHRAIEQHAQLHFGVMYCVGRRPVNLLERAGMTITTLYQAPTSVAGLSRFLLTLAQEMLGEYIAGKFSSLYVVSAHFAGVGEFTPVGSRVLPVSPVQPSQLTALSPYVRRERLLTVALREFLYIVLWQILLDALAAEHSTRLVATGSAAEWLKSRITATRRQLATLHREASTQELLDIVSGVHRPSSMRDPQ